MANFVWADGLTLLLTSLVLLLNSALTDETEAPIYRESEFISFIPDSPHLVMFFAPWCSHCQQLLPLWNNLAKHFSKSSSPVTIAKVDCTLDTPLCAQEDIKAYPTMRLFNQGKKTTYRGQRDVSDIIKFTMKNINGKGYTSPEDALEVELDTYRFEKELQHGLKIVNFYAPWCPHCKRLAPTWQKLAQEFQYFTNVRVLQVNCEKEKMTCKKHKITGYPKIITFHEGMQKALYQGDRSFENLKYFVEDMIKDYLGSTKSTSDEPVGLGDENGETEPLPDEPVPVEAPESTDDEVVSLRKDLFDIAVSNGKTFVYFYAPWCKFCKQFSPVWENFAREVIEKGIMVKIAKVDCTVEEELCQELKVTSFPTIRLYTSRLNFIEYNGERNVAGLLKFVRQHAKDEL